MHVAVCIVAFNSPRHVALCIAALGRSQHSNYEVIICENGGPVAFEALCVTLPARLPAGQRVRAVMAPGNLGYAGGVNLCMAASADADAWWILNPDTEPFPQAMGGLVARLEVGDCDAVGSALHLPSGVVQSYGGMWQSWLARASALGMGQSAGATPDAAEIERLQNYLNGASMMVGRRFLELAGPMREDYFLYCEEVEWCLRARDRGLRLGFAPNAAVLHHHGAVTGNTADATKRERTPVFLGERNRLLLTRDRFPSRLLTAAAAAVLLIPHRYWRRRAWRQSRYAFAGWWAGVVGERGRPAWVPE